ncbi:MAG: class B sortase [Oscillospiraceae bacterium]|nr:class B sortase [Oscillospiraceae bacterium]
MKDKLSEKMEDNLNKKKEEKQEKKKKNGVLFILLGLGLAAAIGCTIGIIIELRESGEVDDYYSAMIASIKPYSSGGTAHAASESDGERAVASTGDTGVAETEAEETEALIRGPSLDFESLRLDYPEVVAWILIEGTPINYPVMQASDNDFYLTHLPNGSYNKMGSVFMDYRNAPDFSDLTSLIYGHNTRSGNMFGSLKNYNKQSYYEEHPLMILYTPERDYDVLLFAGYVINTAKETPNIWFGKNSRNSNADDGNASDDGDGDGADGRQKNTDGVNAGSGATGDNTIGNGATGDNSGPSENDLYNEEYMIAFENHINDIRRRSVFSSDVEVNPREDRFIYLCTCTPGGLRSERMIVVGKIVE